MALTGKINLSWEYNEDEPSFILCGKAIDDKGEIFETETEIDFDEDCDAESVYDALWELCSDLSDQGLNDSELNEVLAKDEGFSDEDEELLEDFFNLDDINNLIIEYEDAIEDSFE